VNGFIKLFRGKMQLNLGKFGRIEQSDQTVTEVNTENNLSQKEAYSSEERPARGGFRSRGFQRGRRFR
ncbi:MAG: single-stranded DNA-binding protein, partial [Candidatus Caldarchaeum sp.]|nr:single-stranded DNA-binding protein [Candidatus Caldarchaeum sp.]MDW8435604.1 hypothetical protein [Candidatus Caldarchaeum sp.]